MKKTVTLDIAGASYRMQVDADEEHLRKLADIVNERVRALGPKALSRATPTQLLVMVALGLADDLQAAESRSRSVEEATRRALTRAIARIDARLSEDMLQPADA